MIGGYTTGWRTSGGGRERIGGYTTGWRTSWSNTRSRSRRSNTMGLGEVIVRRVILYRSLERSVWRVNTFPERRDVFILVIIEWIHVAGPGNGFRIVRLLAQERCELARHGSQQDTGLLIESGMRDASSQKLVDPVHVGDSGHPSLQISLDGHVVVLLPLRVRVWNPRDVLNEEFRELVQSPAGQLCF